MVRKQFCIDEGLDAELAETAKRLGVSQGEIVRRALRSELGSAREDTRAAALARLDALFAERSRIVVPQRKRTWTREDAYDD